MMIRMCCQHLQVRLRWETAFSWSMVMETSQTLAVLAERLTLLSTNELWTYPVVKAHDAGLQIDTFHPSTVVSADMWSQSIKEIPACSTFVDIASVIPISSNPCKSYLIQRDLKYCQWMTFTLLTLTSDMMKLYQEVVLCKLNNQVKDFTDPLHFAYNLLQEK